MQQTEKTKKEEAYIEIWSCAGSLDDPADVDRKLSTGEWYNAFMGRTTSFYIQPRQKRWVLILRGQ